LPHQPAAEEREHRAEECAGEVRPDFQRPAGALESIEEKAHADVLAALEGVREREEAGGGHAIARIGVGAAQVEARHAADHAGEHHQEDAHHEKRREISRGVVEEVEEFPHFL
jgi:hypothetical protein